MDDNKKRGHLGKGIGSLLSGFDYDAETEDIISKTINKTIFDSESVSKADDLLKASTPLNEEKVVKKEEVTSKSDSLDREKEEILDSSVKKVGKETREVLDIDISKIKPNKNQPRKSFDEDGLKELSESIKSIGIIQPLILEKITERQYSIIAGERRYRAAKLAGLKTVPAVVVTVNEAERIQMSLIENLQREDLNPMEEASAYRYLIDRTGYTQEEVARRVGKTQSSIANSLRLLNLPDNIQDDVASLTITPRHARVILSLVNPSDRILLRNKIVEGELTVSEAEKLAEAYNRGNKIVQKNEGKSKDEEMLRTEQKFVSALGIRCELKGNLDKGTLKIKYKNVRDLEKVYSLFTGGGILFDE